MTKEEYIELFHALQLNLIAFKPLIECEDAILKLINVAIQTDRETREVIRAHQTPPNS